MKTQHITQHIKRLEKESQDARWIAGGLLSLLESNRELIGLDYAPNHVAEFWERIAAFRKQLEDLGRE